ncbi:ABC transporter ATP-binding protein [Camelimonas abortus]|uniref:ABC transporter ATP-binding protein n=1 Tax=Camelimonas abortus TaxID=1017184 RepID=A0ABV7LGK1_9HYPH
MQALEARDLTVILDGRAAVRDVSLRLGRGEVVGLIGPNGAGKSTLLRALAGILPPARGAATLDGAPLARLEPRSRARAVAFLAQSAEVSAAMRVEDVVALGRLPHRRPFGGFTAADAAAVARALAGTGCEELRGRPVGALSGGERMRALLARALAVEAPFLLADEPVAALDPLHQLQAMALLRARAAEGAGVLVTLHDLTLASRFCDRLALMAQGRLLRHGPPAAVLDDAAMAAAYGVRVAHGQWRGETFVIPWSPAAPAGCAAGVWPRAAPCDNAS